MFPMEDSRFPVPESVLNVIFLPFFLIAQCAVTCTPGAQVVCCALQVPILDPSVCISNKWEEYGDTPVIFAEDVHAKPEE